MSSSQDSLLHSVKLVPHTKINRVFAAIYSCAIILLLCHNFKQLIFQPTTTTTHHVPFSVTLALFISDIVLAFMWVTAQALRMYPVQRKVYPENLHKHLQRSDYPALDVFICTADPYKEPPMSVVNTALSVMAYDYPTEKLSVYVSDDGGSAATLFAFMEAAKFASQWLPFCREKNVVERSPHAFFASDFLSSSQEAEKMKMMYETMKVRVEQVLERGKVGDEYITTDQEREAFMQWDNDFTRQDHPTVIQVLLENTRDKDVKGNPLPNLVYFSREKSQTSHHRFKAGALNALLRVSASITNAPIILTLDCDMYSNDQKTPIRVLCYYADPEIRSRYGYIQFPQHFHGVNKDDIYAAQVKRLFEIQPLGFDGLRGSNHVGTCCFFFRRVFFGGPDTFVSPEIPELSPYHVVDKPIQSQEVLDLAYKVACCNYENQTNWGFKESILMMPKLAYSHIGYKYGSLVEDYFTGYCLQIEGWRSIYCNPDRAAFLGDAPISLIDILNQLKRWAVGVLQVGFSKYSPITFGHQVNGFSSTKTITHFHSLLPRTIFSRVFAAIYALAILALLYHHAKTLLLYSTTLVSFSLTLILLIADLVFVFQWVTAQALRMCPIYRKEFPENLDEVMKRSDYPALDVFICTADPYKEPPCTVVNTALSVMAYDYPTERISVYVSDDGGSALTLFAFMEAAKFARHWLPFCRENNVVQRSPNEYFESGNSGLSPETMYEGMKAKIEVVVETGEVSNQYISSDRERKAFKNWTKNFTRQEHPTIIELRVSAVMTNSPIILTLDCDMCSNDPQTAIRALCYYSDPEIRSKYGYIQFPQRFRGINKNDIYAGEVKRIFQITPMGFDGLMGANHVGTGCFFFRRVFFGGPSGFVAPEIPELDPFHVANRPLQSQQNLALAYKVAGCNYEDGTSWGSKANGLQIRGWRSIFCNPERAAFLGDAPISLVDLLGQQKRWAIGFLDIAFSKKYSPITFGIGSKGLLTGLAYSHNSFIPIWSIPVTIYAVFPQLALLHNISIFPKEPMDRIFSSLCPPMGHSTCGGMTKGFGT
ncbi:hypothetical protein Tsubulata_013260, partial [Turnera subulata]